MGCNPDSFQTFLLQTCLDIADNILTSLKQPYLKPFHSKQAGEATIIFLDSSGTMLNFGLKFIK